MGDNEKLCAVEPRLRFERSSPKAALESGTARSVDQRLQPTELPGLLAEQYPLFNFQNKCGRCRPIFSLQHTGGGGVNPCSI